MSIDLLRRLKRVHAAMGSAVDLDLACYVHTEATGRRIVVSADWSHGRPQANLEHDVHAVIHEIAGMRDAMKVWAKANGKPPADVENAVNSSAALAMIVDLDNAEKHPQKDRPPRSGFWPTLGPVGTIMMLQPQPRKGSRVTVQLLPSGPRVTGDGAAGVVPHAAIMDASGNTVGGFYETACTALDAIEAVLKRWGAIPA